MDWLKWAIPLIVVAIFILSNLRRQNTDEPPQRVRRPERRPEDADEPQPTTAATPRKRRNPGEVERFLEEINRRRLEASQRRERPVVVRPVEPPPLPRAEVPTAIPVPSPSDPLPTALPVQRETSQPRPRARPVERPLERSVLPVAREVIAVPPPMPSPPVSTPSVRTPVPGLARKKLTPAAAKLFEMLQSRDTLRAAFLLREILDPPLCKRRR